MPGGRIGKDFLRVVRTLRDVFDKADSAAFEQALRAGDIKRACRALHMSERDLTALLSQGAAEAAKIAREDPEIAVTALRRSARPRTRRRS